MHELSIAENIVSLVAEQAERSGFSRVRVIRLELGAFSSVEEQALRFCFGAAAQGSAAEEAELDVVVVPGEAWCLDCNQVVQLAERLAPCPHCGGGQLQVTGGQELRVRELEVD